MTNQHGGKRANAGRPKGLGPHGETTKPMRIPLSKVDDVKQLIQNKTNLIPLFASKVAAGLPSPTDDHIDDKIDLNEFIVKHPASTFMVRATGESMQNAGIFTNDILVVDKSIPPIHGKIVIAAIDGELTVKRLHKANNKVLLMPENPHFAPIDISHNEHTIIWGVVTNVIKEV